MNRKKLLVCLAIPLTVGALAALLSGGGMAAFAALRQPPLSPPGWVFPVVWTVLYLLMGFASYLILTSGEDNQKALTLYALQLAVNFLWPILFFGLGRYGLAFVCLVLLWVLILATMRQFYNISKLAGDLLLPYLLWVTFAGYLNFAIWMLNS